MECETAHERAKRHLKAGGYVGGHGEAKSEDKAIVRKAIGEHDRQLHSKTGSHVGKTRLKFKRGGHVEGKASAARPDRKRRASGGGSSDPRNPGNIPVMDESKRDPDENKMPRPGRSILDDWKDPGNVGPMTRVRARGGAMVAVDRRYAAEGISQPHGPEKRAAGGAMRHKSGGKGKIGAVNIAIKAGGGQAEKQMAAQKGLQAGMMIGARRAAMGGAGGPPGAPPWPPPGGLPIAGPPPGGPPGMMAGPGPMRPGGGMAGGPPMAGPPPGAMPPRPPGMMAGGGDVRMRDERGRFLGGAI